MTVSKLMCTLLSHRLPFRSVINTSKLCFSTESLEVPDRTVLYDFHVSNAGKMVSFAGFSMPVTYGKVGIAQSHKHVRSSCGLFDVSHMLQTKIHGKDRIKFIESLIVGDIQNLPENTGTLSLFTNNSGGILDDLICSKINQNGLEYLYVVSNAGCRDKDLENMQNKLATFQSDGGNATIEVLESRALVALQGPNAANVLQKLTPVKLDRLYFMNVVNTTVSGSPCTISRCGYTGEDGFELSMPNNDAVSICEALLDKSNGDCQLAGLGARDSLRLEAGLCLYGNDIDESTTPIEARLAWTIGKSRREAKDFPGAQVILDQLKNKPSKARIGLKSSGPPPRSHCQILDQRGNQIGEVTSGCPSPSLGCNVAMGYVSTSLSKAGTEVLIQVRNKQVPATITKMPFVKCNYYMNK